MSTRILVVDDNADTLRVYERALIRRLSTRLWPSGRLLLAGDSAFDIVTADTLEEAIEKLQTGLIDVLIVDLFIPGSQGNQMGGKDLISLSLDLDPLRPIVVVTAYGSTQLMRSTFAQGVFDFIEKSEGTEGELVAAVQRALDIQAEKLLRSGNPFTPMAGLEPRIFGGRRKELEFFEQKLNRAATTSICEHFLVLGDWGIGKSTLLREYKKLCRSRGHVACVIPLEAVQEGARLSEIARSLIEGIIRDCPYPVERFKRALEFFQSFGISVLGSGLQFSRDVTQRNFLPQAFLHDALLTIKRDLQDAGGVLVLLLDDLDNFQMVPEIVMTIRQTLSMQDIQASGILFGMSSTPKNWKTMTSADSRHPLARYFISQVHLGALTEDEVFETIKKSLAPTGVSFSTEISKRVCSITKGHPFEMQLLCSSLFDNQVGGRVGPDVWDISLQTAITAMGKSTFDGWLEMVTDEERDILRVFVSSDGSLSMNEILAALRSYGLEAMADTVIQHLSSLSDKRIIERLSNTRYCFSDGMLGEFIRSVL